MAKPLKYTKKINVRLTEETDKQLAAQAKIMHVTPAECARIIIQATMSGGPIELYKYATDQQLIKEVEARGLR